MEQLATMSGKNLHAALTKALKLNLTNPLMEVLESVKCDCLSDHKAVKFTTSNLDTFIETVYPAESVTNGAFLIPAKAHSFLLTLKDAEAVSFEQDESKNLHISFGTNKLIFPQGDIATFPAVPKITEQAIKLTIEGEARDFVSRLNTIKAFTGNDDLRPMMTGICFTNEYLIATDSRRIMMEKHEMEADKFELVIPKSCISAMAAFNTSNKPVRMISDNNFIRFNDPSTLITSRLLQGKYPPVFAIIPAEKDIDYHITVDVAEFKLLLAQSNMLTNRTTKQVTYSFDKKAYQITIIDEEFSTNVTLHGKCQLKGEPITVAYNGLYLSTLFDMIKEPTATIKMVTDTKPHVIQSQSKTLLIMPLLP